jgi:TupA-like ATPgrasp
LKVAAGGRLQRLRLWLIFGWRHRRALRLSDPRRLTDRIQRRKLADRDPAMVDWTDKLRAKAMASDLLGPDWVTPTLWTGMVLPAEPNWPVPFVVKSRHGCNQNAFVRNEGFDWARLRRRARRWIARPYGRLLDEWAYRDVPRGLVVEPFVGSTGALPVDYKIFVFGGRASHVQVHLDRAGDHRWLVLDRDWRVVEGQGIDETPERPASLSRLLAAAETIGAPFDFVRVDFYEVDGQPRFGELAFYPGSGLLPVRPDSLDLVWGRLWRAAEMRRDIRLVDDTGRERALVA